MAIAEVLLIRPRRHVDARGYFMETYRFPAYCELGIDDTFVQDNQSLSRPCGTVRGLHFQSPPHAQAKLVRVLRGSIFDVAVDLRIGSPTYGKWVGTRLSADGAEQLYVPAGFAHGFCTLEPDTEVTYKASKIYAPQSDSGIRWNDPEVGVDWPFGPEDVVVSCRDARLPFLSELVSPFKYRTEAAGN